MAVPAGLGNGRVGGKVAAEQGKTGGSIMILSVAHSLYILILLIEYSLLYNKNGQQ